MKYISVLAVVACGLTAGACTVKTERTVVERPAPAPTVVYAEPAPAPTVVYVPR